MIKLEIHGVYIISDDHIRIDTNLGPMKIVVAQEAEEVKDFIIELLRRHICDYEWEV